MAAAGNANAGKGGGDDGVVPPRTAAVRAQLVKLWEYVIDNAGDEEEAELIMTLLPRDARAEETAEEEERRARVFEPWYPTPPGSAQPPPPRVDRTAVLGLRAPPHLLPRSRPKHEGPGDAAAAGPGGGPDLGRRSVKPAKKTTTPGGV